MNVRGDATGRGCFGTSNMTYHDIYNLSPFEKWMKFREFPLKAVLHFLIVATIIAQSTLTNYSYTTYGRATEATLDMVFAPEKDVLLTVDDVLEAMNATVQAYYTWPNTSVSYYQYIYNGNQLAPLTMVITRLTDAADPIFERDVGGNKKVSLNTATDQYQALPNNPLPFLQGKDNVQRTIWSLCEVELKFTMKNIDISPIGPLPFIWEVSLFYDFDDKDGQVTFSLRADKSVDASSDLPLVYAFSILSVVLITLATLSLLLGLKHTASNYHLYTSVREKYMSIPVDVRAEYPYTEWKDLPTRIKLKFFSYWSIFNIIGNLLIMASSLLSIVDQYWNLPPGFEIHIMSGLGSFLLVINLMRYLEFNESFYILILSLEKACMRVLRFVISCVPIYYGYALCGVALFSQYTDRFVGINAAMASLYALINGDEIHQTFVEVEAEYPYPFIARVYLYSFISIFLLVILNIFIFVIEAAYQAANNVKRVLKNRRNQYKSKKQKKDSHFDLKELFDLIEDEASKQVNVVEAGETSPFIQPNDYYTSIQGMGVSKEASSSLYGAIPNSPDLGHRMAEGDLIGMGDDSESEASHDSQRTLMSEGDTSDDQVIQRPRARKGILRKPTRAFPVMEGTASSSAGVDMPGDAALEAWLDEEGDTLPPGQADMIRTMTARNSAFVNEVIALHARHMQDIRDMLAKGIQ
eukprot:TRINITY_DN2654_c0_g1_i1.p1 TRINITY_DN2654_c0_g1~~TRINITY_DN2654_c0_g1_i1.p1  ORF type:complete len:695 (-),score=161.61 TRINITY_DN2654_c0_g1_i1:29-2113(-)